MSSQEDNGLLLIDELQDDDELSSDDPVAQREPSSALDSYQEDENSDHESDYMAAEHDEADLNGDTFSKTTSGYNGDPVDGEEKCQNCRKYRVYKNNLCYKCRGCSSSSRISHSEYHKLLEEEFVSKCLEAGGRRRVSNRPLTFTEEFLNNPKRQRIDPKTNRSLPILSSPSNNGTSTSMIITTTSGIKQELQDEETLPDLGTNESIQEIRQKPEEPKSSTTSSRIRECEGCHQVKMHHAKGFCLNCYRERRKSEAAASAEKRGAAATNDNIRHCVGCLKQKPHYAKDRCKQCYQTWRKNINKYGDLSFETTEEGGLCSRCGRLTSNLQDRQCTSCIERRESSTRHHAEFGNYRVCQTCKEFKPHHCRGMCRNCYEVFLKSRRHSTSTSNSTMAPETMAEDLLQITIPSSTRLTSVISNGSSSSAKQTRSQPGVTRCVVCSSLMRDDDLRSQRTIVCRKCHQEGKTRHRWCHGCGQLRVHDGQNRCRPCHLALKKGIERGPIDLANSRYRGKFDSEVIGQSLTSSTEKQLNKSDILCIVCEIPLKGDSVWSKSSFTCRQCTEKGLEKMRWCVQCNQLKFHHQQGKCRECYKAMIEESETTAEDLTTNDEEEEDDGEQSDLLNQINAIFDQLSSNNNQTDPSSTLEQPGNSQRARQPPTHATCTEPQISQEEAQQTIEELMTPAIVNCLVCRMPIDFTKQVRNSKICIQCRNKGLSRMRWCMGCNKLKFHQGRGRCQECYRAIRNSDNIDTSKQQQDDPINTVQSAADLPSNKESGQEKNKTSSSISAEQLLEKRKEAFASQIQAICQQFNDLEEAQQLPLFMKHIWSLPISKDTEEPTESIHQSVSPQRVQSTEEPAGSLSTQKCLICPNYLDFSKQPKIAKVCLDCTAKNLKRHRWCMDCKQLKPCIGRGRCSFCYTVYMRKFNAQNPTISKTSAANIAAMEFMEDTPGSFGNEISSPEALLQQIIQATSIQMQPFDSLLLDKDEEDGHSADEQQEEEDCASASSDGGEQD